MTPSGPPVGRGRRRGFFWPLVLIALGGVFLLGNYGVIPPVSFVAFLALWPVLLILLGVDIAFARRWPVPTLVAELVIIALALILAASQPAALSLGTFSFGRGRECPSPVPSASLPRGSASMLTLQVNGGAARYRITGGAAGLVEATSDGGSLCLGQRELSGAAGTMVTVSQSGSRFGGTNDFAVRVANEVPLALELNAGAGDFFVDLHDVRTVDARLRIGAASATLVLPRPTGDVAIRIDGGASSLIVEIPEGVEARITVAGGLVSASSANPRATKDGNTIQTTGYAAARDRVSVTVNGGASSVTVR